MLGREPDLVLIPSSQGEQCDAAEGWITQLHAEFQFLFVKADEVMTARKLNRGMKRRECLHNDFAFDVPAPGASGDLRQQLKRSFSRPEVRLMQCEVGVNDSDQSHVWKVQAFGDHLRADQDVDLAGAKIAEDAAIIFFSFQR